MASAHERLKDLDALLLADRQRADQPVEIDRDPVALGEPREGGGDGFPTNHEAAGQRRSEDQVFEGRSASAPA